VTGAARAEHGALRAGGYEIVLALLVVSLVIGAVVPTRAAALSAALLAAGLWFGVAHAASVDPTVRRTGVVVLGAIVVTAGAGLVFDSEVLSSAADLAIAVAVAAVALVIGRGVARDRVVTLATILGVVCLYLLIGLFFAQAYLGVRDFDSGAFSAPIGTLARFDLIYFSFVTLTTVGFGDIVPAVDLTRALAATEAVLGQLFLVTVLARVVSMLGQERLSR